MAVYEHLVAFVGRLEAMIDAEQEEMKATLSAYREATKACLEKMEPC
jgi:hypothetical protein